MISFKYSTRFVILFNRFVIKIPLSRRGYLQGINEKYIWDNYKDNALLAELKWMRFGIVCQKRYTQINSIPKRVVNRFKEKISEFNFDNCDLYNYENWGKDGKKYILLDYGVNEYIASLYKHNNLKKL
jgi:hypothetical protein